MELKTTSFRLNEDYFGNVFMYKLGPRFKAAWLRLSDGGNRRLRYGSLQRALTVHSGDFVYLDTDDWKAEEPVWFFFSREKISEDELRRVLMAWELAEWPETATGELAKTSGKLPWKIVSVASKLGRRSGRCPAPEKSDKWIWKVAVWEVAHLLTRNNLRLDGGLDVALRLDSEGCLLTWDNLRRAGDHDQFATMHKITPRLITIPGLEVQAVHLESSCVRLSNRWARHGWIDADANRPLVYTTGYCRPVKDESTTKWECHWSDTTQTVLRKCGLDVPAEPSDVDLKDFKSIRAQMPTRLKGYMMGSGPGQNFHDLVALHALQCLPGAENVEMEKAYRTLPKPRKSAVDYTIDDAIVAAGADHYDITCLYGNNQTALRAKIALCEVLGQSANARCFAKNGVATTIGRVSVVFSSPEGDSAEARLSGEAHTKGVGAWAARTVRGSKGSAGSRVIRAAIIETGVSEKLRGSKTDPKSEIRRHLAAQDVVTQFLDTSSFHDNDKGKQKVDYPAKRAVWDMLRSSGVFLKEFPSIKEISHETWLVGIHVHKPQKSRKDEGFIVSIVAVKASEHKSLGYGRGWRPLNESTAKFLASDHNLTRNDARSLIDMAVAQLLAREPHAKAVLFVNTGCRGLWNGLMDTGGDDLPSCRSRESVAIVRTRTEYDYVPRVARIGDWSRVTGDKAAPITKGLYQLNNPDYPGAWFYVSVSLTMDNRGEHRNCTRFTCDPRELSNDWHAMTMTEFLSIFQGPFSAESLYKLSAVLCRHAPTWDGTLRLPSPLHLAQAIADDYRGMHADRDAEEETAENGE